MNTDTNRSGGLTADDHLIPGVDELVDYWRDFEILTTVHTTAYAVRDALFTDTTSHAGSRGPGRGLSGRLAAELDVTESAYRSVKARTRRERATNGEPVDERKARAIRAAVHAAADAYRDAMGEEGEDHENAA